jgi:hypothetical protein
VGTAERRGREAQRARRLLAAADPERLPVELHRLGVLGLGGRIVALGGAPPALVAGVEEFVTAARPHGVFQQMATLRILAALEDAGVPAAPLKGPLLAERIYGDSGVRASSDIDVLVAPEDLERAVEAARALGYAAPDDRVDETGRPLLHFTLHGPAGELELHWRVHWYEERFAARALGRSRASRVEGRRFAPVDELAMLLLFYARDAFAGLRLAADVAAWWDRYGTELGPGEMRALADEEPALAPALATASAAAHRLTGVPDLLAPSRASRLALRLANWTRRGSSHQLGAEAALVDLLLSPRSGRRAFLRRQVLVPAEAVADWLPSAAPRARVRGEQVTRPLKLAARWALALTLSLSGSAGGRSRSR